MKKCFTTLALTLIFFGSGSWFLWTAKYTVTASQKYDEFSGVKYGYKIEHYYFWDSMRLTIWNKRGSSYGMRSVYDLPALTVDKIVEEKWLKDDAAIYLNLQLEYHDSLVSTHPAKIIYDFHRGEIYTLSGFTLWRFWNGKSKTSDWMSEDEFNDVLSRLSE